MVIVTASTTSYFGGLINLVGSIHTWAPDTRVLVYDLGLKSALADEVEKWRNVYLVNSFIREELPAHFSDPYTYAWKPWVINHALGNTDSVLWIDAGSDFRGPIEKIETALTNDGYFFVKGQDADMTLKSHDDTYSYFGLEKSQFFKREHFSANLQGYVKGSSAYSRICQPMYEAAFESRCICPAGSDLNNHRFDQTVLSILAYQSGTDLADHTHLLAYTRSQLSEDPWRPSERLVFTARASSRDYAREVLDDLGHKLYRKEV